MKTLRTRVTILLVLAFMAVGSGTQAWADDDHERAWRAVQSGRALPLAEILQRVGGRLGGEIIAVEFEREDGRYVYEFKIITPSGRLQEVYVDALSAEILKIEDD
jgi:uncharacterized membrane protein YkoI